MQRYTNQQNIPLSLAVWLAHDSYDYNFDPNYISTTSLLKSIRQIVLGRRIPVEDNPVDVSHRVPSSMGTAIHDGIEKAWLENYQKSLKSMGYPQKVIERVRVNPDPKNLADGDIPVYLEQRVEKEIEGFRVSGKFDFVGEGRVEDFKTTSTYTYVNKTNDEKYILQGSIYRWLSPHLITQSEMAIQFIFTDWNKLQAIQGKERGYPQSKTMEYRLPLKSLAETEAYIRRKLTQIKQFDSVPEPDLPYCTDLDLWRKPPVYKYYKNPEKTTRATKNFDNPHEANLRQTQDGGKGIIIVAGGEVVACKFCDAFDICTQKDAYISDGTLKL